MSTTPHSPGGADLDGALEIAREAVARATEVLEGAGEEIGQIWTKSTRRDLVTEWDTRAEEAILEVLARRAPEIPVLAEEGGGHGERGGGSRWLVDPIDGTVNFTHGIPMWGVSVALEESGRPVVGVVAAPALGWEFWARRGGGAFLCGEPIRVSGVSALEQAALATGFAYDRATTHHNFAEWAHFQTRAGACRRFGAASLDLCMVARGWLDGYWEDRLKPWDQAAGAVLVEEAGGTVTDFTGGPFVAERGEAVASNGAIHEEILRELGAVRSRKTDASS